MLSEPETLFWSPAQVAATLGVSRVTVYRMISAGELPSVIVRGQYRIPKRALARSLLASRVTTTKETP